MCLCVMHYQRNSDFEKLYIVWFVWIFSWIFSLREMTFCLNLLKYMYVNPVSYLMLFKVRYGGGKTYTLCAFFPSKFGLSNSMTSI